MLGFFLGEKMKKYFIISIFVLVNANQLFAVGEAGAIFLLIAPGAGPAGTGEAQVAKADDAYASYYNPAGMGFLENREVAGMHVNWLPNLADDLYYEYLGYHQYLKGIGTIGGHIIFLNLGEQLATDDQGNELYTFQSDMWALTTSFGTTLSTNSSIGLSFKILQQNLAPSGAGSEDSKGSSTDFAFDLGYLLKMKKLNFGTAITNIGPKIWFKDQEQADPAPTNMRLGLFSTLYNDGYNKINFLFDANKMMVTRYPSMDWNGDGIISGDRELMHDDPWYLAIITAWLDDWLLGGDLDKNGDGIIGGWNWESDCDDIDNATDVIFDLDCNGEPSIDEIVPSPSDMDFNDDAYGQYNNGNINDQVEVEKGSKKERSILTEFQEMIYNTGVEYWYTENFALRAGYIYDYEGKIMNPTFGAGIRLLRYGFDFGYTAGEQGHPRANTMFFSINMKL